MEISGGSGQCDCKGWSHLNRVWNILPYFMLLFLGGICLQLRGTVWSHGGAFLAFFACALHRNHLHPLPPATPTPFFLQCLGCLSQLLKGCCMSERPAKAEGYKSLAASPGSQVIDQGLSNLGYCCQSACSHFLKENWKVFVWFENK